MRGRLARVLLVAPLVTTLSCSTITRLPETEARALAARRAIVFVGAERVELAVSDEHLDYDVTIPAGGSLGLGTAFPVTADGLLLTAGHTFDPPGGAICVYLHASGAFVPAELVHLDLASDLAVLKIAMPTPNGFPLASAPPAAGALLVSSGTTRGTQRGAMLGLVRVDGARPRIEFERAGTYGDSGGALLDADGRAVGVIIQKGVGWRYGALRRFGVATAVDAAWWGSVASTFVPDPRFVAPAGAADACNLTSPAVR